MLPWQAPGWRGRVDAWLDQAAGAAGHEVQRVDQGRERVWSTHLVVTTDRGLLWFKQNHAGSGFEAALLDTLAELVPGHTPEPVATQTAEGWLLTADAGPTVYGQGRPPGQMDEALVATLRDWSALQVQLAARAAPVLGARVPAIPSARLLDVFDEELERAGRRPLWHPLALDRDEIALARAHRDTLVGAVDTLGALGLPDSLDHNDLHHNNVFAGPPHRAFDLGDAVWGQPLATLHVPAWTWADRDGTEPTNPVLLDRLTPALEPWSTHAPMASLQAALPAVMAVGCVHRYVAWRRVVAPEHALRELAVVGRRPATWLLRATGLRID